MIKDSDLVITGSSIRRFFQHVDLHAPGGCWNWTGALDSGYGAFSTRSGTVRCHIFTMKLFHGPCPPGLHVDHLCLNRPCCNPFHLERVTPTENQRRQHGLTHCKWGHERTPENTYLYPSHRTGQLVRYCKPCKLGRTQAWRDQQKVAS